MVCYNNGLNKFDRSTNRFIHFSEKNGLPSNNIRSILEDDHGNLWLNTTKGISKFNPETNKFKNYDVSYGVRTTCRCVLLDLDVKQEMVKCFSRAQKDLLVSIRTA